MITLNEYLQASKTADSNFEDKFPEISKLYFEWDCHIRKFAKFLERNKASFDMASHSHALILASIRLTRSGHWAAVFPLLRTAFEAAAYACLFIREKDLSEKWINRHESEENYSENKTAFTPAMKRFRKILIEYDKTSGESPYEEYIMSHYDASIDFGAHPNPIAVTNSQTPSETEGQSTYSCFGNDDFSAKGIFACIDYATAIAITLYLSHHLENPESKGLDETFFALFKKNNHVADMINGKPIGFEERYYSHVNKHTSNSKKT